VLHDTEDRNKKEAPEDVEPDKRDNIRYWQRWVKAAKKAAKPHWDMAAEAYAEYLRADWRRRDDTLNRDTSGWYPLYNASVKTIEPAFYARTPKITTDRKFDASDALAESGSIIIERLASNLLETSNIDDAMQAAVQDFIHADKTTVQIVYEADVEEYEDGSKGIATNQRIYLAPVCYDEIIHNPEAKTWSEITDIGIRFTLSWEQAVKRFGEEKCNKVKDKFKVIGAYKDEESNTSVADENPDLPGKYLQGWEISCLYSKKIYWVAEDYTDDFLDSKEDTLGLRGMFPCPKFRIGSKPPKSLYPTPAYQHCRELLLQLHAMQGRMFSAIRAMRRRVIVDAAQPELVAALNSLEGEEYITAENAQGIVEKGGLANMMFFVPVQEYVEAVNELSQLEDKFKNSFYEWFGVPDILRGASDPVETAAAQEIKQGAAHDRFKFAKKQIQDLARDAIEMMVDLALKVYDDTKIALICGYQYMTPEEQQIFPQALAFLRSDEERIVRIDIETNSTNFVDEHVEAQNRLALSQSVITGMQQVGSMIKESPEFAAVALHAITHLLDGQPGGKEFIAEIKAKTEQIIEQALNPEPVEPPPDYEGQKLQIEQGKITQDGQIKMQELQTEAALRQEDIAVKREALQLEAQKIISDYNLEQFKNDTNAKAKDFDAYIKQIEVQIEQLKAQTEAANKDQDNRRLEIQAVINATKLTRPIEELKAANPAINLHLNTDQPFAFPQPAQEKKSKRKLIKVRRTPEGLEGLSEEIPDPPTAEELVAKAVAEATSI